MIAPLTQLYKLLAQLFLDAADADTIMAQAGIERSRINAATTPASRWHAIVAEANKDGKVVQLIDAALERYPKHEALLRLKSRLVEGCTQ